LPKDTKVKVYVGDKYQSDTKVNIYYYNEKNNKMDLVEKDVVVTDEYIEFEIEHCSEYIITRTNLNNTSFNIFMPIATIETILIAGYIIYTKFIKKTKVKKG